MTTREMPKNFETYAEARKSGFVPMELIYAAGAAPIGLCAFTDEPIPAAEAHLPRNLCPLIKASFGFALSDTCPYFYFSDFVVGETTCDGERKMFELLNEIKPTYVMQLPSGREGDTALQSWEAEAIRFKEKLEDFLWYHDHRRGHSKSHSPKKQRARCDAPIYGAGQTDARTDERV